MRAGKIVSAVFGSIAALIALGLTLGGVALVIIHATQRDAAGFYHSSTEQLTTPTYAITSGHLDLDAGLSPADWATPTIGTIRIRAAAQGEQAVFVGIARTAEVDRYLAGAAHDELTTATFRPFRPTYQRHQGEVAPEPPASQPMWVARASGTGPQTLLWDASDGNWTVVVMNADATPGVFVDTSVGLRTGLLLPIGLGLLAGGLVIGAIAAALLVLATRPATPYPAGGSTQPAAGMRTGGYPVRVTGSLEPRLSRGRWLVKWLLVIPHAVVLFFLWLAYAVLTAVAGVAILITGRYPRSIFDFNVGVLRWTWRVTFYATTLGTDRYPPFTLAADPSYPADLEVDYPQRLSRPLVLVKWWLLALPHYLVISIFGGGLTWWTWSWASDGDAKVALPAGLIGLLAVIAGVILLFSGRYPPSLFDFIMGMQRWTYRVIGYVSLMCDEYPPFRLDSGGSEPAELPGPPPTGDRTGALIGG
jgi:hypothetical protein